MITTKSKVNNFDKSFIIATVSSSRINFKRNVQTAYIGETDKFTFGHSIFLSNLPNIVKNMQNRPLVYDIEESFFQYLQDGDVIAIYQNGTIHIIWDKNLNKNDATLFMTNQCNANCIMCPQPPKKDEHSFYEINKSMLNYIADKNIYWISITGGEPTLKSVELLSLLRYSQKLFPKAKIDLLTNAKKLEDFSFAKEVALSNPNITFCVSFPSDDEDDFNMIMGTRNFTHAISAIQNLGLLRQMVELRIVIMEQNYNRLLEISEFIYRNFPFVVHIAFMGLEIVGNAHDNFQKIDILPLKYSQNLLDAVVYLKQRDMNISIYNVPFCLLDKKLWPFIKNSISKWKQTYKEECRFCAKIDNCPGIFSTTKESNYKLEAIKT